MQYASLAQGMDAPVHRNIKIEQEKGSTTLKG